jgi:hypothetical protein
VVPERRLSPLTAYARRGPIGRMHARKLPWEPAQAIAQETACTPKLGCNANTRDTGIASATVSGAAVGAAAAVAANAATKKQNSLQFPCALNPKECALAQ